MPICGKLVQGLSSFSVTAFEIPVIELIALMVLFSVVIAP